MVYRKEEQDHWLKFKKKNWNPYICFDVPWLQEIGLVLLVICPILRVASFIKKLTFKAGKTNRCCAVRLRDGFQFQHLWLNTFCPFQLSCSWICPLLSLPSHLCLHKNTLEVNRAVDILSIFRHLKGAGFFSLCFKMLFCSLTFLLVSSPTC